MNCYLAATGHNGELILLTYTSTPFPNWLVFYLIVSAVGECLSSIDTSPPVK